jgi:hypothetical protein
VRAISVTVGGPQTNELIGLLMASMASFNSITTKAETFGDGVTADQLLQSNQSA